MKFLQCLQLLALFAAITRCAAVCEGVPGRVVNNQWNATRCGNAITGAVCTGDCNDGYPGGGPPTSTCLGNGSWSTPTGSCKEVCGAVPPMTNMNWAACTETTAFGKRCNGTCTGGTAGSPSLLCQGRANSPNGGWNLTSLRGSCQTGPVCLGLPPRVVNSMWPAACWDTKAAGSCRADCNPGYGPGAVSDCSASGTWLAHTGMCQRVCTTLPPVEAPGGGSWPSFCAGGTVTTRRCNATCPSGWTGKPSIQCVGGTWNTISLLGRCVNGPSCGSLPPPTRDLAPWPNSCIDTPAGGTCKGECKPGRGPVTGSTATCNADGTWTVSNECFKACNTSVTVPGISATWVGCEFTRVNTRCNGTCASGLAGSPSVMCTGRGWNTSRPSVLGNCVVGPVCTMPFPRIINGEWPLSCLDTTKGGTCIADCNDAYQTPGATMTCGEGGVWGPVLGACNRTSTAGHRRRLL